MPISIRLLLVVILSLCAFHTSGHANFGLRVNPASVSDPRTQQDTAKIKALIEHGQQILGDKKANKLQLDTAWLLYNEAIGLSKQMHSQKWQNEVLFFRGDWYLHKGDTSSFKACYKQVTDDYHRNGQFKEEAQTWTRLGEAIFNYSTLVGDPVTSLASYEHARSIYAQHNLKLNAAQSTRDKVILVFKGGLNREETGMQEEMKTALAICKAAGGDSAQLEIEDFLAQYCWENGDTANTLSYYIDMAKSAEAMRDTGNKVMAYSHLGVCYYSLHLYTESLKYYRKALPDFATYQNLDPYYSNVFNCVTDMIWIKQLKDVLPFMDECIRKVQPVNELQKRYIDLSYGLYYTAQKKYNEAEGYYLEVMRAFEQRHKNEPVNVSFANDFRVCYISAGNFYLSFKQFEKARPYFETLVKLPAKFTTHIFVGHVQEALFRIDSASGRFVSAIDHLEKSRKINDSIFSTKSDKQISELTIKYKTDQQLQSIKLLNSEKKAQFAELSRVNLQRNIVLGGALTFLVIAGLAYNGYRLKRKSNEVVLQKNDLITHKNELLQNLVEEKEWLLKEVHHRVKNNLHTVICLLESQAAYLQNDALEAIEKSQHRIYTMSLIHQKLYQSDDIKTIDMAIYIPELVKYLSDSFDIANRVHFNLAVEPINLNASQAVPLALLINEALTNSIKYAFPDKRRGEITIALTDTGEQYKLELADNGIGLPKKEQKTVDSLGMDLMKGLAKEVRGSIDIENSNGVKITVVFEHDTLDDMDILEAAYFTSLPGEA